MIRIQHLHVRFGAVAAVIDLSLHVPAGRCFGLLGPNGAGKSTTIACVAGLLPPSTGSIHVDGVDVAVDPVAVRRRIGVVPQRLALYPTLDVRQNLQIAAGLAGVPAARAAERVRWGLALAQLDGRERAVVATLSGGMQRRLNLACALLHDPKLVICDEPTTGVDPQSRNHLFDAIRALHREGRTIVYTTHYMEEVEALCDEVAIVDHGTLVTQGSLESLLRTDSAAQFSVALNTPAEAEALRAALDAAGLSVATVAPKARSLEAVFLEHTGRALRDAS